MSNFNETPRGSRIHISLFGKTNSGKSSIINALTGQNISLVSDFKGTTTDPVYKAMELLPLGPVVFIDTAGFDDEGEIGKLRVEKTEEVVGKTDVALITLSLSEILEAIKSNIEFKDMLSKEILWLNKLKKAKKPAILVINKCDLVPNKLIESKIDLKDIDTYLSDLNLIAYEKESADIKAKLKNKQSITFIIGPEGGFDPVEYQKLVDIGFESISLGKRILRAETAAIYLASIIGEAYQWKHSQLWI